MIETLQDRLQAYIPEVLLTVGENVRPHIEDFINASVVSVDFAYVRSTETADEVVAAVLNQECINQCKVFIQNINRFGHIYNSDNVILRNYYPDSIVDTLSDQFPELIALAFLNAGHAALIKMGAAAGVSNVKPA